MNRVHRGMAAYPPEADQGRTCGLCLKACPKRAITPVKAGGGNAAAQASSART